MVTGPLTNPTTFFESGLSDGVNDKRKLDNERGSGVRSGMIGDGGGKGGGNSAVVTTFISGCS